MILKVLVACEFSATVRDEFIRLGHDAISCDFLPSEKPGPHYQGDVRDIINDGFDLMVAFPPCTYTAVSGARWFESRRVEQRKAIRFFMQLINAPIKRICLEHPVSIMSTRYRKPDQIIQPYQFGHGETKKTCLWLKNLPLLHSTRLVSGRQGRVWKESPGPDRWKNRSRTYSGIGKAMAKQWG